MAKIPASFNKEDYPQDFTSVNPFCASCSKFISLEENFMAYNSSKKKKKYLVHD